MLCTLEHAWYLDGRGSRRWLQPQLRSICRRCSRQSHQWGALHFRWSLERMMRMNSWLSGVIGRSQWKNCYYHHLQTAIYTLLCRIALASSHECWFSAGRKVTSELLGSLLDNFVRCETQLETGKTLIPVRLSITRKHPRTVLYLSYSELQKMMSSM